MSYTIPLSRPYLSHEEIIEVNRCIKSSWISSKSPWVEKFEHLFAQKISQTKYAISVNSGTSAIFLALKSLGIGPGDEVILPTFTMIATINAVVWAGATPVLVDSTSHSDWNMDPGQIEQKITKRTKAIIPVHIYGYICDMEAILAIAKKHKLYVIEDAAEAMGSEYHKKRAGKFGILSCFSLYSNKIITTGNGGLICTNSKKLYSNIKKMAFFSFNAKTHFKHIHFGYNLVLSGMQGALGYAQTKKFDALIRKRREVYFWYKNYINSPFVFVMPTPPNQNPNYWFPAVLFKTKKIKNNVMRFLEQSGVETRDFFIPIHRQPLYRKLFKQAKFNVADHLSSCGLLLPSFHTITQTQVEYISNLVIRSSKNV
jgi:perosamine synthetase